MTLHQRMSRWGRDAARCPPTRQVHRASIEQCLAKTVSDPSPLDRLLYPKPITDSRPTRLSGSINASVAFQSGFEILTVIPCRVHIPKAYAVGGAVNVVVAWESFICASDAATATSHHSSFGGRVVAHRRGSYPAARSGIPARVGTTGSFVSPIIGTTLRS